MRLKRLEVFGFKSFADRMEFDFVPGLTGIVGPNGCGKSNVVDAIRWVLGEQRPTQLRGTEMTDVIFKGTTNRQGLGFAEVTVVLDNEGGGLPSEYSEVSFTRRLFRTGESEYLLNRQPSRLKDIREILLDTGLGVHSYTILEQGKIDAILAANPVERRAIFEEAAGISKFRLRRKEAVRKIEQVQQNLLRLGDLLAELESGIRSLKIQASKARRFQEFHQRLKELRIALALHHFRARSAELEEAKTLREKREAGLQEIRDLRERQESEIRLLEEEVSVLVAEISREASVLEKAKMEEAQAADRVNGLEVRMGEWERERQQAQERRLAVAKLGAEKEEEAARILGELERSREGLAASQRILEEKEEAVRAAARGARELSESLAQADREVLELMHLRTEAQNRRVDLDAKIRVLEAGKTRLQSRSVEMEQTLAFRKDHESKLAGEAQSIEAREQEIEAALAEARNRRESLEVEAREAEDRFQNIEQRLASLSSRQQVLRELAEGREGLDVGAKALLDGDTASGSAELSLLADRVQIDLRYARALETALLGRANSLVTFHPGAAAQGMARLRREKGGRAFFALAGNAKSAGELPAIPQAPGVIGRLLDQLRCGPALMPLMQQWIGDCVLVEDGLRAASLSDRHAEFRFVTPEGDLFAHDLWIGGEEAKESGLISRRSLLDALEVELTSLREERERLSLRREEMRRSITQAVSDQDRVEAQRGLLARESAVRSAGVEQARGEISRLGEELELLQKEIVQMQEELARSAELLGHVMGEVSSLDARFQVANDELKRLHAEKGARDMQREEAARAEAEVRLEVERLRGAESRLLGQRELLAAAIAEMQTEGSRLESAIAQNLARSEGAKEEIASLHEVRAARLEQRSQVEESLRSLRQREEELRKQIRDRRSAIESKNEEFESLMAGLSEAKLAEQKLAMTREELCSRIRDEFQTELESVAAQTAPDASFLPEPAEAELGELRQKLDRLGSINLEAVTELEEKEGRFGYLTGQRNDLEQAKKLLHETIEKIDIESRERFAATFRAVQEQFQQIFRQLFRGGKADLLLEEGVDLLEAGIVVQAKPPGKELRNIDLLSGGERTLTALALLFSLFRSKPSPFCLLDEVDAALDDANVERFLGVLQEFTKDSQFILVTHNKRTMTACNLLYGVTMQDNGVSKKVAVELGEGEEIRFISPAKKALEKKNEELPVAVQESSSANA